MNLSTFAETYLQIAKPTSADFEMELALKPGFALSLCKFVDKNFETYDYQFESNGVTKSIKLLNETANTNVRIELLTKFEATYIEVHEYVNDTVTFTHKQAYESFNEFKKALNNITELYTDAKKETLSSMAKSIICTSDKETHK